MFFKLQRQRNQYRRVVSFPFSHYQLFLSLYTCIVTYVRYLFLPARGALVQITTPPFSGDFLKEVGHLLEGTQYFKWC